MEIKPAPLNTAPLSKASSDPITFNLAGIALLVLLVGIGGAYYLQNLVGQQAVVRQSEYAPPYITQILSGTSLRIPKAWYHPPLPNEGAFSDQIDVQILVGFAPGDTPVPLDVRITPTSGAQPSAYLLDAVYLKQFSARQIAGPVGLIGKPLKNEEGFQNETVWYDPLSAKPFVAKCIDPVEELQTASCLRTVYQPGNIAVTYQFPATALKHWRQFDAVLEPWLLEMGIASAL